MPYFEIVILTKNNGHEYTEDLITKARDSNEAKLKAYEYVENYFDDESPEIRDDGSYRFNEAEVSLEVTRVAKISVDEWKAMMFRRYAI